MGKPLAWLLVCIAASAMTTPAAAESVNGLIASGEQAIARMHKASAKIQELQQRSEVLSKVADAIDAERSRLHGNKKSNKSQIKELQESSENFKLNCYGYHKSYRCPEILARLNREITETNAKHEPLKTRQQALKKQITQYNVASQKLNQEIPGALKKRNEAFDAEQAWLNRAIDLISSKKFMPYIPRLKAAGCPSPSTSVTSAAAMKKMAKQMLECLRNFARTKPAG